MKAERAINYRISEDNMDEAIDRGLLAVKMSELKEHDLEIYEELVKEIEPAE